MKPHESDAIRNAVRDGNARVAESNGSGCGAGCCGPTVGINARHSTRFGYSSDDLERVPTGADLGLGCGNQRAVAGLREGDVVLDPGSVSGFDCFLAAHEAGETGRVIGVDMTPAMISEARGHAVQGG